MTSPSVDAAHIDCRATIGRLETEISRVLRERDAALARAERAEAAIAAFVGSAVSFGTDLAKVPPEAYDAVLEEFLAIVKARAAEGR